MRPQQRLKRRGQTHNHVFICQVSDLASLRRLVARLHVKSAFANDMRDENHKNHKALKTGAHSHLKEQPVTLFIYGRHKQARDGSHILDCANIP